MPEEEIKVDLKKLRELFALIVTKKEEPTNRDLSFFGWDDRYEFHGKKGTIFSITEIPMLNAIGLKEEYWNPSWRFIDFDQLLKLYQYAECALDAVDAFNHNENVQRVIQQINDLSNTLKLLAQQKKEYEKRTFNRVLTCMKIT